MKPYHRVGESFLLGLFVLFFIGFWAASCISNKVNHTWPVEAKRR